MSSKIEEKIDEIEDYLESCKPSMFNNNKITVDKDVITELLRDLRMKTPDEIKRYQRIISNKEAILKDAQEKAEAIVKDAAVQTTQLVNEQEIMRQAEQKAQEYVEMAAREAQAIVDQAAMEANQMRMAAIQYTDDQLAGIENLLGHTLETMGARFEAVMKSLGDTYQVVADNRTQLYPVEAMAEENEPVPAPVETASPSTDGDGSLDVI